MSYKSKKITTIFIIYWILLLYVIAALVWWFVALSQQNERMTTLKIQEITKSDTDYQRKYDAILSAKKRKEAQYIGEGAIFLLLISAGAIFIFRAVKAQLKTTEQQKNFMMAITHELKTPIAITKLNLETLQKRKLEISQQEKLINNTLQEANRMNALCNNLLLSYQMESLAYQMTSEKFNFSELLSLCVKDFAERFPLKKISTSIDHNIFLEGDSFLLQMTINNLIENAIKYSPKESPIFISLKNMKTTCSIEIQDQGNGISDMDKIKVFEKFYRTGTTATQKSKGTGLGLFLVKRIILAHKGSVSIKDNNPQGSIFNIQLPIS